MLGFLAWVSSIFNRGSCFHTYTVAEIRGRPREFEHAGNVSGEGRANLADVSIGKAGMGDGKPVQGDRVTSLIT